jgi:hypothetical protein
MISRYLEDFAVGQIYGSGRALEAELPDVAGMDGRSDQLHPRLQICPLRHRRRGAGFCARYGAARRGDGRVDLVGQQPRPKSPII